MSRLFVPGLAPTSGALQDATKRGGRRLDPRRAFMVYSPVVGNGKPDVSENRRLYWRANVRLIAILLGIWFFVSYFCGILFVEFFNKLQLGRLPLGYWFANQGSMYVFVVLIWVYARRMQQLDRQYKVEE